ncbi:MAG TPA: glycosyltransferase [Longimicrobiales bacterium]|nr:glycosyltransferase [Longimicrobiales bacterium]
MTLLLWAIAASPVAIAAYAYFIYPALLRLLPAVPAGVHEGNIHEWPHITISLPVYNEEAQIRGALDSLIALDYPADRRQIVVISDASDDGTDDIVREFAGQGVELLRMPKRGGKTAGENAGAERARGEIVVNTDASIRIRPAALKKLIARFADPEVGVASGRDLSVAAASADANAGEAGYVGYEMGVRALETRAGGIIGASGCFYAIRTNLHRVPLPGHLSRDFASALIARDHGFRAVSVDDAICLVPRTASLKREYRRKVRTISRGIQTLHHLRHLLNPARYGRFAWMLWSHKVARWAVAPTAVLGVVPLTMLATLYGSAVAAGALLASAPALTLALAGWNWPASRPIPRLVSTCAAAVAANVSVLHALIHALSSTDATWEPTRRDPIQEGAGEQAGQVPASVRQAGTRAAG